MPRKGGIRLGDWWSGPARRPWQGGTTLTRGGDGIVPQGALDQPSPELPTRSPTRYVIPAAPPPRSIIRRPPNHHGRLVTWVTRAPATKSATRVRTSAGQIELAPSRYGSTGTTAPIAKATNDE